jgi:PIN domain nuclease of toxin-antitoxin system
MVRTALPDGPVVVDASFLVGIATQQRGAARFASLLSRSIVTSINFGETLYKLKQLSGTTAASTEAIFSNLGVSIEPVDLSVVRHFPHLKEVDDRHRKSQESSPDKGSKSLSLADIVCLGFSRARGLPVLTGDKHWLQLDSQLLGVSVFDFRDPALTV